MADLAKSKVRRKFPDLVEALTGSFDDHHALLVSELLAGSDDKDATLEVKMAPWAAQVELLPRPCPSGGTRPTATPPRPRRHRPCR